MQQIPRITSPTWLCPHCQVDVTHYCPPQEHFRFFCPDSRPPKTTASRSERNHHVQHRPKR